MASVVVQCPQCFARTGVPPEQVGTLVTCSGCDHPFLATTATPPPPPEPPSPPAGEDVAVAAVVPPAPPAPRPVARAMPVSKPRRAERDDRDEDRPRSRRRDREGEDDRRAAGSKFRDRRGGDEDDRPARRAVTGSGSALPVLLLAGGALFLLVVGGVGAVAYYLWTGTPPTSAPVAFNNTGTGGNGSGAITTAPETKTSPPSVGRPNVTVPSVVGPRGDWNDPNRQPFLQPKEGPNVGGPGPRVLGPGGPLPFEEKPKEPKAPPKYAAVRPVPIKPAPLAEETTEVKLPGAVSDTCVGGGGRFFLLHLGSKKQVAVFDVTEAKVVKYIPLTAASARIAAGMNKLVVIDPDQNTATRYDLTTFDKEATVKLPTDGTVKQAAMGSASAGPLMLAVQKGANGFNQVTTAFLDPTTMKEVDIELAGQPHGMNLNEHTRLRASPDGGVFAAWSLGGGGQATFVVRGGTAKRHDDHNFGGYLTPGPDGSVFAAGGLSTPELKKLGKPNPNPHFGNLYLPAVHGHLYLVLTPEGADPRLGGMPGGDTQKMKADVRMMGDERTILTIKGVNTHAQDGFNVDFQNDRRYHFAPDAHLLATVPAANDRIVIRKFDLEGAFEQSGVDYLYVASRAPTAVPGKGYEYQIVAKSKKGGVKYTLESGPDGMKVSDAGKLTWAAPRDFDDPVAVILTVKDASGQEIFHTFDLAPGDGTALTAGGAQAASKPARKVDGPAAKGGGLVQTPERVFEIKPPPVQVKTAVPLPAPADAVCVGGGGRFLILRLPQVKQLAVLDVTSGRLAKLVPLAEADALFAAGMTKLFVFNKSANVLQRWDLEKFEKDVTAQNPAGGSPTLLLLGHSSDGPLYVGGPRVGENRNYAFLDARTLKEIDLPLEGGQNGQPAAGPGVADERFGGGRVVSVSVSPDGRVYAWTNGWGGSQVMTIGEKSAKVKGDQHGGGNVTGLVPGPDGTLFGPLGLYTADLKKVGDTKQPVMGTNVPATSGPWYFHLSYGDRFNNPQGVAKRKVGIGLTADEKMLLPLGDVDGLPAQTDPWQMPGANGQPGLPLSARVCLVPEAETLAVLNDAGTKVHLHRVRVKALLEKEDREYLLVAGRPRPAGRGQKWEYAPQVWSKKGGVTLKVDSGPDGMRAAGGTVTWDVPAKFADDEVSVILTVKDGSGQETFHTFSLSVRDKLDGGSAVLRPTAPAVDPKAVAVAAAPTPVGRPTAAFRVTPTQAKDKDEIALPGEVDSWCYGGGGRFILFRVPDKKQLLVLDTSAGKVIKALPLPEADCLFAAGMSRLIVYSSKADAFIPYSLTTFEKGQLVKSTLGGSPKGIALGHESDGPLFAYGNHLSGQHKSLALLDPLTLKPLDLPADTAHPGTNENPLILRASPDGRAFVYFYQGHNNLNAVIVNPDGKLTYKSDWTNTPFALPAADGAWATAYGWVADAMQLGNHTIQRPQPQANRVLVPGATGKWFLDVATPVPPNSYAPPNAEKVTPGVTLKLRGDDGMSVKLPNPDGFDWSSKPPKPGATPGGTRIVRGTPRQQEPLASQTPYRFLFVPAADLLVVINGTGDKLHLNRVNAKKAFDDSGSDACLIQPTVPPPAVRGQKWAYTPEVWSKKGGVTLAVSGTATGAKADGGTISWEVPKDLLDNSVAVTITATDAGGKEATQTFTLDLVDAPPGGAAAPVLEVTAKADSGIEVTAKVVIPGVKAAAFDAAWAEYVKGTGLKPAEFAGDKVEVKLSGQAVYPPTVGGGGRYLIYRHPVKKKAEVVDLSAGKVAFEVPLPLGSTQVAANRTHLFVYDGRGKKLERFDLATGKGDKAADLSIGLSVAAFVGASGSSDTPLLIGVQSPDPKLLAIDPNTLEVLPDAVELPKQSTSRAALAALAPSADGRRVVYTPSYSPDAPAFYLGTWTGKKYEWTAAEEKTQDAEPFQVAGTGGVYSRRRMHDPKGKLGGLADPQAGGGNRTWHPSAGPLLVAYNWTPVNSRYELLLQFGPDQPAVTTPVVTNVMQMPLACVEPLGVVAVLAGGTDTVTVHKFDLPKLLAGHTGEEPLIALAPPPVKPGEKFACTPAVWAKGKERPTLRLTVAPPGMALTADGRIEWQVPKGFTDPFVTVTMTATDAAGRESELTVYPVVAKGK